MRPRCDKVICVGISEGQCCHLLDVCTCSKCLVASCNHNSSDTLVFFIVCQCFVELDEKRTRKSIECPRSVESDCRLSVVVTFLPETEHILKPTPGFGLEMMMFSYVDATVDSALTNRGNVDGAKLDTREARGLAALKTFIAAIWCSLRMQ